MPISLAEWKAAVGEFENVRLIEGPIRLGNGIEIENLGGAAEFFDRASGEWLPAFDWRRSGSATFRAGDSFGEPGAGFEQLVRQLALMLNAKLVGDEGEFYD